MRSDLVRAIGGWAGHAFLAVIVVSGFMPFTAARAAEQPPARTEMRAAQAPVDLGSATTFSVLAGQSVTNTGPTVVSGDLGVSPGTSVTGFPPGTVGGTVHAGDATAAAAQTDLTTAYNDAAGRTPATPVSGDIGGQTLLPGVYNSTSTLGITGTVTLDAQGDPNAVFIIQVGSALTTATSSVVNLVDGAQACNVFWQVGSSATLGTNSTFQGTILAQTSITVTTGVSMFGRALARTGAVTLDTNTITTAICAPVPMMQLPVAAAAGLAMAGLAALRRRRRARQSLSLVVRRSRAAAHADTDGLSRLTVSSRSFAATAGGGVARQPIGPVPHSAPSRPVAPADTGGPSR